MKQEILDGVCLGMYSSEDAACTICLVVEKCKQFRSGKKPMGRPKDTVKRQHIIDLALANKTLSMKKIAEHVGCSEALVAKVFDERSTWEVLSP